LTTTDILSNFGEKRVMDFNTIITGNNPTVVNSVKQFLRSTSDNTQNNPSVVNVYEGKYRHVILEQLATTATGAIDSTKKNYWALAAIGNGLRGWQGYFVEWEPMTLIPQQRVMVQMYTKTFGIITCVRRIMLVQLAEEE